MKILIDEQPTVQPEKAQLSHESTTSDLISRQDAIDAVRASYDEILDFKSTGRTVADSVEDIISELPPAQPEPQEGHWIRRDCGLDVECKCSKCGYRDFVEPRDEYWFKRNYCPNCGAKMTISTK